MEIKDKLEDNAFHSKILLFGEYGIIQDAMGLSIPFESFNGKLSFGNEDKKPDEEKIKSSNANLKKYALHLKKMSEASKLSVEFDLDQLFADIEQGMFFESTIPQGFGVGSSGALCAAIYDRYAKDKVHPQDTKIAYPQDRQNIATFFDLQRNSLLNPKSNFFRFGSVWVFSVEFITER